MLNGSGKVCEKCLGGDFSNCVKNKCIKGSKLMSMLSAYEAKYIRRKHLYDKVDLYICPSEFHTAMLKKSRFTKSEIICIRNPLPLDTCHECNDDDDGYLLYFGRLSREKGVATLIDAAIRTNKQLIVLGTGPMEAELKARAQNASNISFKGFQQGEALTNYIRKARCVVLPSECYENGPYSAMEAMALGKPLIVSDLGGLPELVEDGNNGYIYSTKEELDACIGRVFALTQDGYTRMCRNASERARNSFDPEQYVDRLLQERERIVEKQERKEDNGREKA